MEDDDSTAVAEDSDADTVAYVNTDVGGGSENLSNQADND